VAVEYHRGKAEYTAMPRCQKTRGGNPALRAVGWTGDPTSWSVLGAIEVVGTFQGPDPDDIFIGIVQRGAATITFKAVGVQPVPNCTRDVKQGIAWWDAYLHVPDPDGLAGEFSSRSVPFSRPLRDTEDGLRGFEVSDPNGYVLVFGRTQP